MLLCYITLSSSRETQRSAQEVARRISGAVAREVYAKVNIPSTHHKPLSHALHYLPFASRFPLPHFTLAVLFALSLPFTSFSLAFRLLVCWIACLSRWLYLDSVIFTLKGWKRSKAMSGVLWFYNLSIIISLETRLRNKRAL